MLKLSYRRLWTILGLTKEIGRHSSPTSLSPISERKNVQDNPIVEENREQISPNIGVRYFHLKYTICYIHTKVKRLFNHGMQSYLL